MNEQQSTGASPSGGGSFPTASPGGNSPVLGGPTPGMGGPGMSSPPPMPGSGTGYDHRPEPRHVDLPHRMPTRRDETTRAGQHRYAPRSAGPERHEDNTVQTVALGVGGALLVGWLMSRFMFSGDRGHDREDERYDIPRRRSREDDWSDAGRSHYATPGNRSVATDETWDLIASDKVEGTAVYDRRGERDNVLNQTSLQSSFDHGKTFTSSLRLSSQLFDSTIGFGRKEGLPDLGSRLGLISGDRSALGIWTDTRAGTPATQKQDLAQSVIAVSDPARLSDSSKDALRYGGIAAGVAGLVLLAAGLVRRRKPVAA